MRAIPLGGVGEVGKNMMAIEYRGDLVLIDAGAKFPEEEQRGIDLIIPDTTYLTENLNRFRAILLTHGHEDHIGSLPYLVPQLDSIAPVPMYGSRLALAFARNKLEEAKAAHLVDFMPIDPGVKYRIGHHMEVEFIPVTHSIPGSMAISISTPVGRMIHTGDFKFDPTPPLGPHTDERRLRQMGDEGVLALFSDTVRIEREGSTHPEQNGESSRGTAIGAEGDEEQTDKVDQQDPPHLMVDVDPRDRDVLDELLVRAWSRLGVALAATTDMPSDGAGDRRRRDEGQQQPQDVDPAGINEVVDAHGR